ncbi:hypothetical protein FC88_GL001851 [Companilactobacillus futsaii JCM 17355]|nr:hypothetical protein FC88_GL001851 [Companilactobacillus futsaii JCM 17355]
MPMNSSHNLYDIGKRITNLREQNKISQETLASYLNIDRTSLSRLENGKRKISSDEIKLISKFFNVTADYLLGISQTPAWATKKDTLELRNFIDENSEGGMTFDGEDLTKEEKEKVEIAMTQIFWEKLKKIKAKEAKKNGENK